MNALMHPLNINDFKVLSVLTVGFNVYFIQYVKKNERSIKSGEILKQCLYVFQVTFSFQLKKGVSISIRLMVVCAIEN